MTSTIRSVYIDGLERRSRAEQWTDADWHKLGYSAPPVNGYWVHGTAYKSPTAITCYWDADLGKWLDVYPITLIQGWLFDD